MHIPLARVAVAVAGALIVGAGASACTSSPGAAALVGDDRISVETLQSLVNRSLADPQAAQLGKDRAKFTRDQLGRLPQTHHALDGRQGALDVDAVHPHPQNSDTLHTDIIGRWCSRFPATPLGWTLSGRPAPPSTPPPCWTLCAPPAR